MALDMVAPPTDIGETPQRAREERQSAIVAERQDAVKISRWQKHRAKRQAIKEALLKEKKELAETENGKASFFTYSPVLMVALLKDLLDLVGIGSLPAIGTIVTICFSLLIFLLLLLLRTNAKLIDGRFVIKIGVLMLVGSLIEFLPGLNLLPIETTTICLILWMDRHLSDEQIEKVLEVIRLLEKERD